MIRDVRVSALAARATALVVRIFPGTLVPPLVPTAGRVCCTLVAILSFSAGCSLVYKDDLDKKQCEVNADCPPDRAEGTPYFCNAAKLCEELTCNPECPKGKTCSAETRACVAAACTQDLDCGDGSRCGYNHICYAKWDCLSTAPDWPTPKLPFHVRSLLRSVSTADPAAVGDVAVDACLAEDATCSSPLTSSINVTFDEKKTMDLTFKANISPDGFSGYIRLKPTSHPEYLPAYILAPGVSPWVADYTTQEPTQFADPSLLDALQTAGGIEMNRSLGLITLALYDCGGRAANDVKVMPSAADAAPKFYPLGAGNIPSATSDVTGESGQGLIVNPPTLKLTRVDLVDVASQRVLTTGSPFAILTPEGNGASTYVAYYPRYSALKAWMDSQEPPTGDAGI